MNGRGTFARSIGAGSIGPSPHAHTQAASTPEVGGAGRGGGTGASPGAPGRRASRGDPDLPPEPALHQDRRMTDIARATAGAAAAGLNPAALQDISFFRDLGDEALSAIAGSGRAHRLPRHAALFEQGTEADALHLLLQGRLKVVQTAADGQRILLRFVGPRELAGVFALLGPAQRYPATVLAVVDCVLLSWDRTVLPALLARHPQLALNALQTLGCRTQEAHARLREGSSERVERRLALTLLRLIRQAGAREAEGAVSIDFPLSRQDLAEMAGTTLHTTSRIMSGWEQAGILAGGRMRVVVRSPHALMRITEG